MTATFDRPDTAERYSNATVTSHLEVKPTTGDVDLLIAAGWLGPTETLGTALYRLRVEFDACDVRRIKPLEPELAPDWTEVPGNEDAALLWHAREHERIMREFAARRVTAKALALLHMKSLRPTVEAVGVFAWFQAKRLRYEGAPETVNGIVGRAVDLWLDPICHHCCGRGFNGGFGVPLVLCVHCGGTKVRRPRLAKSEAGHQFGLALLVEMDRKAERVAKAMTNFLKTRGV